jgi:competence protein ComGC
MAKKDAILLIILPVFAIIIVSVIPNSIKEHQASATIAGLGSSLANAIKQKVSNAIEASFNQTLSGLNNQSSAANVTNKQTNNEVKVCRPQKDE